jgi:hypothetical protein
MKRMHPLGALREDLERVPDASSWWQRLIDVEDLVDEVAVHVSWNRSLMLLTKIRRGRFHFSGCSSSSSTSRISPVHTGPPFVSLVRPS